MLVCPQLSGSVDTKLRFKKNNPLGKVESFELGCDLNCFVVTSDLLFIGFITSSTEIYSDNSISQWL